MTVSICVIAYNEEKTLPRLLEDIVKQDYPKEKMEVLLIDSMSTDSTRNVMVEFVEKKLPYKRVVVLENPKKRLAPGWNIAVKNAQSDIIVRVDAHASIPEDFISANVICHEEGECVTGGPRPNVAEQATPWQNTLLLAESSMFGSSIADYRREGGKTYVKSLFHGAYRREVFEKVGLFNEQLGRTEDNEMNYRIRQAGYKLCFDPRIHSYQFTRSTLKKMMKQKYGNGEWVVLTLKACPKCLSIFHFVPLAFVFGIGSTSILAALHMPQLAIAMWGIYWALAVMMGILAVRGQKKCIQQLMLPILFFLLHISYGMGSLVGVFKLPFWKYKKQIEVTVK